MSALLITLYHDFSVRPSRRFFGHRTDVQTEVVPDQVAWQGYGVQLSDSCAERPWYAYD